MNTSTDRPADPEAGRPQLGEQARLILEERRASGRPSYAVPALPQTTSRYRVDGILLWLFVLLGAGWVIGGFAGLAGGGWTVGQMLLGFACIAHGGLCLGLAHGMRRASPWAWRGAILLCLGWLGLIICLSATRWMSALGLLPVAIIMLWTLGDMSRLPAR